MLFDQTRRLGHILHGAPVLAPSPRSLYQTAALLLGMALLSIAAAAVYTVPRLLLKSGGQVAEGTVIEMRRGKSRGSGKVPVVAFDVPGHGRVLVVGSMNNFNPWHIGERAVVYYDPSDPEDAIIDGFSENWSVALIVGVVDAPLFFFAFLIRAVGVARTRRRARIRATGFCLRGAVVGVTPHPHAPIVAVAAGPGHAQQHFTGEALPEMIVPGRLASVFLDGGRYFVELD